MTKALQITFDEVSLSKLLKVLSVENSIDIPLDDYQDEYAETVAKKARANAEPNRDRGDLIRGIKVLKNVAGIKKGRVVAATEPHSIFVHEGTRPHWPPVEALRGWAKRHGFTSPFPVAHSIARKGTPKNPFLKKAFDESRSKAQSGLKVFARSVEKRMDRA